MKVLSNAVANVVCYTVDGYQLREYRRLIVYWHRSNVTEEELDSAGGTRAVPLGGVDQR